MIDQGRDNPDDFIIRQGDENDEATDDLRREDYYDSHPSIFQKKSMLPFVIGGVALVVLIILFFIFSGSGDEVNTAQLRSLEARIEQLEQRMSALGAVDKVLDRLNKQEQIVQTLGGQFNGFESTVKTQIDQIIKELGKLHQQSTPTQAPATQAAQPTKAASKETKARFHEVRAGETLYRISREYDLTVEQLRSYNNLGPDSAIHPGQKLKLTPNPGN